VRTITIANMFEIRLNDDAATFEVYILNPRGIKFIPAEAATILEREVDKLNDEGYIQK